MILKAVDWLRVKSGLDKMGKMSGSVGLDFLVKLSKARREIESVVSSVESLKNSKLEECKKLMPEGINDKDRDAEFQKLWRDSGFLNFMMSKLEEEIDLDIKKIDSKVLRDCKDISVDLDAITDILPILEIS